MATTNGKKVRLKRHDFKCPVCGKHGEVSSMTIIDHPEYTEICTVCAREIAQDINRSY